MGERVTDLASTAESSHLRVWLQGASDFSAAPDHHVRLYLNGTFIEEMSWDGKRAERIDAELLPGFLREGENLLEIESVGDTGADYSMVMLDRFEVSYPRLPRGVDEGLLAGALLVDTTQSDPRWLNGARMGDEVVVRARVESGGRYLVVSPDALLSPVVTGFRATGLRNEGNGADYLLVAPEEFLPAATPLLELRQSEGLRARAVSMEDIDAEFGFGEATPEALKDFLKYAYQEWQSPSPRYVVLLGDATYDFKDYLGTGVHNRVPPLMVKTSYLWTASDPSLAAVNGDDILPDFAIGRFPAATLAQARAMVDKIVAYETGDAGLTRAPIVLVALAVEAATGGGSRTAGAPQRARRDACGPHRRQLYDSRSDTSRGLALMSCTLDAD